MSDRGKGRIRRGGRRLRPRLLAVALVGVALLAAGAVSGLAAEPTIEVTGNSLATYAWTPSTASLNAGESAAFKNPTSNLHALAWESGPETPSCTGTPSSGQGNWSGSCTFAQAGTYKFYCPVHPSQMKGTITVSGAGAPVVSTGAATSVGEAGATLNGTVNPSGQATTYHFDYGTSTAYGQETAAESAGEGNASVSKSAAVTGLSAATTYHFRIVATSSAGTTRGADRAFSTTGPPSPTTEAATKVGGTEATLAGSTNPHGLATTYFFNYGTTEAYGQKTTETSAGSGTVAVQTSTLLTGLSPETTYHFQLVAKNSAGTVPGADQVFTTLGAPAATTGAATAVGVAAATLQGAINPQGQQTTYFFEFGPTGAYGSKTTESAAGKGVADVAVSAPLTGLSPSTTYHFRLVARNASGTTTGGDATFTTAGATPFEPTPPLSPPPASPPAPPSPAPAPQAAPPDTRIELQPHARTRDRTPTVKFTATVPGATFRCSVDSKPFKACRSPFTAPSLKPGRHRIRVEALAGGLTDPTPASCRFKVLAGKRR